VQKGVKRDKKTKKGRKRRADALCESLRIEDRLSLKKISAVKQTEEQTNQQISAGENQRREI